MRDEENHRKHQDSLSLCQGLKPVLKSLCHKTRQIQHTQPNCIHVTLWNQTMSAHARASRCVCVYACARAAYISTHKNILLLFCTTDLRKTHPQTCLNLLHSLASTCGTHSCLNIQELPKKISGYDLNPHTQFFPNYRSNFNCILAVLSARTVWSVPTHYRLDGPEIKSQ